jgi:transaldolase
VNTLPDATLEAFDDHGTVARTIDSAIGVARSTWSALADTGIDMGEVAAKLEAEGVASFQKSFVELLDALRAKLDAGS